MSGAPLQTFEIGDHLLDHLEPDLPEGGVARVEPERREQFGMVFRAAGRKHGEIALGEAFPRALIDAIERIDEAIAERVGVDIERRMDEMRNIGPIGLVIGAKLDRRARGFRPARSSRDAQIWSAVSSPLRRSRCSLRSNE